MFFFRILVVLILFSCSRYSDLNMIYKIKIPKRYSFGATLPIYGSQIAQYIDAYNTGWWRCIKLFYEDIDYQFSTNDSIHNGDATRVVGGSQGFRDSYKHIKKLIAIHGKEKTHKFIKSLYSIGL